MIKQFSSRNEMLQYEANRERYLLHWIAISNRRHLWDFYKNLFLEIFHPKYRAIKKEYMNYSGGWWRDENGYACAESIQFIDINSLHYGDICLERNDNSVYGVYVFNGEYLCQISKEDTYE